MELNTLHKNIFTESQIDYLKTLSSLNAELSLCPERGRADIFIGPDIRQDIIDTVMQYFDADYSLYHVTYSEYSLKHGIPNLPSHKDPVYENASLTFDYQLESNISWFMCAEGICHDMKDNDAIIFDPMNMTHERPELEFKPDDYVRILFFYAKKVA